MANVSSYADIGISDAVVLWNLNEHRLRFYLPAAIITFLLQVIGVSGNSLVIYVYQMHFRKTTMNLFIKTLAVIDVCCCVFAMSFELGDLCFSLMNGESITCKIFRGLEQTFEFISGEILLCIAFDRYLHVCRPLTVLSVTNARRMAIACIILGCIVSSPTFLFAGRAEIYYKGMKTNQCSFDDRYTGESLMFIYYSCLNAIIGLTFITMITMYIRIWIKLCRWQKTHIGETLIPDSSNAQLKQPKHSLCLFQKFTKLESTRESETINAHRIFKISMPDRRPILSLQSSDRKANGKGNSSLGNHVHPKLDKLKRKRLLRPVAILFGVTVVFVASFLPYFILMLLHTSNKIDPQSLSVGQRQVWEVAYKSYFLSNALNPLIYAAFDKNFKTTCYKILFVQGYR